MSPAKQTEARSPIGMIRAVLSSFQQVRETMPIQVASTFLLVAQYPERSGREYQQMTGLSESTMSRHLLDLGARNRKKEPGYGLIEQHQNPEDYRKNVYRLTAKGQHLLNAIVNIVGSNY